MRNCLLSLLSQFSSPPSLSGPHSPPSPPPPPPPQLSVVERDFHSHFILFNWMHVSKGNVWQVFLATRFGARRLNGVLNSLNYTCPHEGFCSLAFVIRLSDSIIPPSSWTTLSCLLLLLLLLLPSLVISQWQLFPSLPPLLFPSQRQLLCTVECTWTNAFIVGIAIYTTLMIDGNMQGNSTHQIISTGSLLPEGDLLSNMCAQNAGKRFWLTW